MCLTVLSRTSILQHGGLVRHAASRSDLKTAWISLGVLAACGACQASENDPAPKFEFKEVVPADSNAIAPAVVPNPVSSQAAKTSVAEKMPGVAKEVAGAVPSESLSGTFRLAMTFDKDVKIRVKSAVEGGLTAQPDGSQVSLLEIMARNGKIVKCVQSLLNGTKMAQQPVCSNNGEEIKLVFADEKAAFSARMEAVVRPDMAGIYKGPLLLHVIIIPNGKRIGELSLSRL